MEGLIDKESQGAVPAEPEKAELPAAQPGLAEEEATPEEQEAFERIEIAATEMIYNEESKNEIVAQLQASATPPAETLGKIAMMLFSQIDEKAKGKIPEEVVLQGALKVLDLLAELAEASGAMQIDDNVRRDAVNYLLVEAKDLGYISESDVPAIQELIEEMGQEGAMTMAQEQTQMMGGVEPPMQGAA